MTEELSIHFWEMVKELCKERRITQDNLCLELQFNLGSYKNRIVRHIAPDVFDAVKIASFFGVTVEYLVTGETTNPLQRTSEDLSVKYHELLHKYEALKKSVIKAVEDN